MNEKAIEAAKRHLARPGKLVLEDESGNKDEFEIKPFAVDDLPEYLEASAIFADASEENPVAWLKNLTKDKSEKLVNVAKKAIQISYPDWDEQTVNNFVAANLMPIMEVVFRVNHLGGRAQRRLERIKRLAKT